MKVSKYVKETFPDVSTRGDNLEIDSDSGVPSELFEDWKSGNQQGVVDYIFSLPSRAESLYVAVRVQELIKDWEYTNPDFPRFVKSDEYIHVYKDSDIFAFMLMGKFDEESKSRKGELK